MYKKSGSLVIGGLMGVLALGGVACSNFGVANAVTVCTTTNGNTTCNDSASATASVTVASSCSLTFIPGTDHSITLGNGAASPDGGIGQTTLKTVCNDPGGFAIYAIGYSNNEYGNNNMVANFGASTISTGTAMSGDTSNWAMKLTAVESSSTDGTTSVPTTPTIEGGFNNFSAVPSTYTEVASFGGVTDVVGASTINGSSITTTYQAFVSPTQAAGEYVGQVKYTLVHPSDVDTPTITIDNMVYLQDFAGLSTSYLAQVKASMVENTQYLLKDSRDEKEYYVAKLADGNIWMTQNLDLDLDSQISEGEVALTSKNTDISLSNYGMGIYTEDSGYSKNTEVGAIVWTPANAANTGAIVNNTVSSWVNNRNVPYSADPGDLYRYTDATTGDETTYNSLTDCVTATGDNEGCKHSHLGNYYNWSAAVASNDTSDIEEGAAGNSICPKGWKLPQTANHDFDDLLVDYNVISANILYLDGGLNAIRTSPLYFVRAGRVSAASLGSLGNAGYYWSSNVDNSNNAKGLDFNGSEASPSNYTYDRGMGYSIRCIAR